MENHGLYVRKIERCNESVGTSRSVNKLAIVLGMIYGTSFYPYVSITRFRELSMRINHRLINSKGKERLKADSSRKNFEKQLLLDTITETRF